MGFVLAQTQEGDQEGNEDCAAAHPGEPAEQAIQGAGSKRGGRSSEQHA